MKNLLAILLFSISFCTFSQNVMVYSYENNTRSKWWEKYVLIMETNQNNVKGYLGMALQGSLNVYFEGKLNGKIVTAKCQNFDKQNNDTPTKLLIDLSKKNPKIYFGNNKNSMISTELVPSEIKNILEDDDIIMIYDIPSFNGKLLSESDKKTDLKILELDKFEKDKNNQESESFNLWYKIKLGQQIGWAFGLIKHIGLTKSNLN